MSMSQWRGELVLPVSPERDHIAGPREAPVTLLEYGDYQCPYCREAHGTVVAILQQMIGRLRFAFRHFPLVTLHPHAELAAEAAEAAGSQGRFWEMHATLYENQQRLDLPALALYADAIGLDMTRFGADIQTHIHAPKVAEDFMSGVRSGVAGTPTFFINGVLYAGSWDLGSLLAAVKAAAGRSAA